MALECRSLVHRVDSMSCAQCQAPVSEPRMRVASARRAGVTTPSWLPFLAPDGHPRRLCGAASRTT